jgi:hypothetical protein
MLPRLAAASCFLFLWVGLALADDKPCTVHDNGKYYDLSKLGAECVRFSAAHRVAQLTPARQEGLCPHLAQWPQSHLERLQESLD